MLNSNSTLLSGVAEHHEGKEMAQQIVNAQQIEDMYDSGVPRWIKHDLWCPVPSGGYILCETARVVMQWINEC